MGKTLTINNDGLELVTFIERIDGGVDLEIEDRRTESWESAEATIKPQDIAAVLGFLEEAGQ